MSTRLYVGNLSLETIEDDIAQAFGQDSRRVSRVTIIRGQGRTGPAGFAFVDMVSESDARAAIEAMNGTALDGRTLRVEPVDRLQATSTPRERPRPPKQTQVVTREEFLSDRHGRMFADVLDDPGTPFDEVLDFFADSERQQRMEDSEVHHARAPLAGVVREFESDPVVHRFFTAHDRRRSARLRRAIGVLVRMIMERRGWSPTGRKSSLGIWGSPDSRSPSHNTRGLALWFNRAERYQREGGMPFRSVRERCDELEGVDSAGSAVVAPGTQQDGRNSGTSEAGSERH